MEKGMSHFVTLNRSVRQIQAEASALFSAKDFASFQERWIEPWRRIVDRAQREPWIIRESAVHRLSLVETLAREAHRSAKVHREDLKILDYPLD
jgi:hypothetical protein